MTVRDDMQDWIPGHRLRFARNDGFRGWGFILRSTFCVLGSAFAATVLSQGSRFSPAVRPENGRAEYPAVENIAFK